MRLADYLRLGFAGVKAHKKRAFIVVIIVGLLFSVITAGTFILQGLENIALGAMLAPTDGKMLVMSSVDAQICGKNCDIIAEVDKIKKNIENYHGKIIPAKISQTVNGMFYKIEKDIFSDEADDATNTTQVVVPLKTAATLAGVEMPERSTRVTEQLDVIKEIREKTLGKIVKNKTGEKYYVAEILPSEVYANNLSFMNIGQDGSPLNLILGKIRTGTSQNFITKSAKTEPKTNESDAERPSGFIAMDDIDAEEAGIVFAEFPDIETAHKYYQDKANYCSETDRVFRSCGKDYKYLVVSAISDPIMTYENLQNVWLVFKIIAVILAIIAVVIAISTYGRLIGKDMKIIALYHAMGATGWQIRIVYVVYLLLLSLMTVGFAAILGLGLAGLLSMVNMTAMRQVFTLGFGMEAGEIWLVGWNNLLWNLIGVILAAAIFAAILCNGNFKAHKLAQKLK